MLLRSGTYYDNEEMVITITVTIEISMLAEHR